VLNFIFLICGLVIASVLIKWLLDQWGITIPQPLLIVLGILIFMAIVWFFFTWALPSMGVALGPHRLG
jgi:hypothetical protein